MKLQPGDAAPSFTLPDQDGRPVDLASRRGRRVLVYFYPKDDTPGCTREACQFNDSLSEFTGDGVDVIGISADDGLDFTLLTDAGNEVATRYGAYGEKLLYGRPTVGTIRSTFLIDPEGRIQRAWYGVRTDGHAAKVLEEVRSG